MNSRKTYTQEQIKAISGTLNALKVGPKVERPVTTSGAVALLIKDIKALQVHGYTIQEIADLLRDNNLPVSAATLKSAIARAQGIKRKKTSPKPPRPFGTAGIAVTQPAPMDPPINGPLGTQPDAPNIVAPKTAEPFF
ncbi:hypothetical protein [Aromatoleum aromaticum]|uniref:hypothetical protein n=1 Tax=Aromatoleum aromaticum TaxID=551760 RepID=UPI0014593225|nr:hypothetical protein [Aromatoleum aromaticum]NMG56683.1 hypothetical protein [Aromatoleum aromaticum]